MALTADEQELLDWALGAMPPWYSDAEARDLYHGYGSAKAVGQARAILDYWTEQTLIGSATGATATTPDWLDQHARDRGTRRQNGESDTALRARLRQYPDALTRGLLLSLAQDMVDAAGVTGDVAMLELRRDRAYLGRNEPMTGTGGTFSGDGAAGGARFTPTAGWTDGAPPWRDASVFPEVEHRLVISGAANAGNNGTFVISGLDGNAAAFTNAAQVDAVDATASWRVDRYDADGNLLTGGSGKAMAYLGRGFRMGARYATILLILPFGTTEALAASILEAVRQRKAAGVRVLVERRLNP